MSLWVPIGIKNAAFKSGLDEMRGQAAQFSSQIRGMFLQAFSVGAIIASFRSWMVEMDRVQKLGQRFNETAEDIQRVGLAAELAGGNLELAAKSTTKVTQAASEAARGNTELTASFQALGIDATAFLALSMPEKLVELSRAYQTSSGSAAAQLAIMKLLGEEGLNLVPLLAQGPEALKAAFDKALPSSQSTVDSVANLHDNLTILGNKAKWLFGVVATVFLVLGQLIQIPASVGLAAWDIFFTTIGEQFRNLGGIIDAAMKGNLAGVRDGIAAITRTALDGLKRIDTELTGQSRYYAQSIDEIINGKPKSKSQGNDMVIDLNAAEAAAQKAAAAVEKLQKLQEDVAAIEKRNREAAMTDEQRLQAMLTERAELLKRANLMTEDGLKAKKEAADLEGKIAEAQRKAEKDKADREKQYQDKLQAAKEAEAEVDEQNQVAGMSKEERRAFFQDKQARLNKEADQASKSGDELKATELRTEAKRLETELRPEEITPAKPTLGVVASSLASVGGGGNVGAVAQDPLLRAQERGNQLLERIASAVEGGRGDSKPPDVL